MEMEIFSFYSTPIDTDKSGQKLPPYLRLPEKTVAYTVAIKVGK
jgi:hypothetical protein